MSYHGECIYAAYQKYPKMTEITIESSGLCTTSESAELLVGYNKALQGKKTVVQWIRKKTKRQCGLRAAGSMRQNNEHNGSMTTMSCTAYLNATEMRTVFVY